MSCYLEKKRWQKSNVRCDSDRAENPSSEFDFYSELKSKLLELTFQKKAEHFRAHISGEVRDRKHPAQMLSGNRKKG